MKMHGYIYPCVFIRVIRGFNIVTPSIRYLDILRIFHEF